MPIVDTSDYTPSWLYRNGHRATVIPYFTKKVKANFDRERVTTPDDDFLDFDWLRRPESRRLAILCHGLEGSSESIYIQSMAQRLHAEHRDVLAWNYRSCSGEINRQLKIYHSGATDDLDFVIKHVQGDYDEIVLVGFSLGGNLVLKYTGEQGSRISPKLKKTIAVSAVIHLSSCSHGFDIPINYFYRERFLISLRKKVKQKHEQFPDSVSLEPLKQVRTLIDFDEYYTGPIHGFDGAEDYYEQCSALQFLPNIAIPSLMINAKDDPFLSELCFPVDFAHDSSLFHLAATDHGGHVWFAGDRHRSDWLEDQIISFIVDYP